MRHSGQTLNPDARVGEPLDDDQLLAKCRNGDQRAWRELVRTHFDFVYRVAFRLGTPEEELDDVCQEAFFVVFRKSSDFIGGRFQTWLYRIAANVVSERLRRRRFRNGLLKLLGASANETAWRPHAPDGAVEAREAQDLMRQVLERMTWKKREAFVLYEIEGLSSEEIAARTGCNPQTVRTRIHHARREFAAIAKKRGLAAALGVRHA